MVSPHEAAKIAKLKWEAPGSVTPPPSLVLVKPGTLNRSGELITCPAEFDQPLSNTEFVVIDGSHRFLSTKMLVDDHFGGDWEKLAASRWYNQYYYTS
jgi:hypothetical protein